MPHISKNAVILYIIHSLEKKIQVEIAIELIEIGLPIWKKFNFRNQIEYTDSVVGVYHKMDKHLIEKSIKLLKKTNGRNNFLIDKINQFKIKSLYNEIREPVIAHQDDDFQIPRNIELILFSTANLIEYVMDKTQSFRNKI